MLRLQERGFDVRMLARTCTVSSSQSSPFISVQNTKKGTGKAYSLSDLLSPVT